MAKDRVGIAHRDVMISAMNALADTFFMAFALKTDSVSGELKVVHMEEGARNYRVPGLDLPMKLEMRIVGSRVDGKKSTVAMGIHVIGDLWMFAAAGPLAMNNGVNRVVLLAMDAEKADCTPGAIFGGSGSVDDIVSAAWLHAEQRFQAGIAGNSSSNWKKVAA